jgi:hypothetical protein
MLLVASEEPLPTRAYSTSPTAEKLGKTTEANAVFAKAKELGIAD